MNNKTHLVANHSLLGENETIVAMDVQQRLEGLGYRVVGHSASGAEAILLGLALEPNLILIDVKIQSARDIPQVMDRLV